MSTRHPASRWLGAALLAGFGLAFWGCVDYVPRGALTIATPPGTLEGQGFEVAVTFTNVHKEPIIPISMALHVRRPAMEFSGTRQVLAETDYLKPLVAAEIRDMNTLNRIEADQVGRLAGHQPADVVTPKDARAADRRQPERLPG
jgi:hypothetical protein